MSESRTARITTLRERIDRAQYHVDVDRVAEAILGRPTARMLIVPGEMASLDEDADEASDEDLDGPSSDDVLEAA